jgi:outer membrane receptor protein involved in Fe transport
MNMRDAFGMGIILLWCVAPGWAQDPLSARERLLPVDVAAQPMVDALNEFAIQTGVRIVYFTQSLEGLMAPHVEGHLTAEQALQRLLKKSALKYRFKDERTVEIRNASLASAVQDLTSTGLDQPEEPAPLEEIVVTGTHIRGAEPTSGLITLDRAYIERAGFQSTADLIRSLPQNAGNGQNPSPGSPFVNNPSGASSPNLRGLGSESTLTLVNGQRLSYADMASAVDINLVPLAAIDRVEVLTDGASAIYGSDAVAGVVNFILNKDFRGVELRGSYGDFSGRGGEALRGSALGGTSWGSGGAVLSYEYAHQDPLAAGERSFTSSNAARTSLVDGTERHSVFVSAHQSASDTFALFAQGLYTNRSTHHVDDFSDFDIVVDGNADVEQYALAAGATLDVRHDWRLSLTGDHARNKTTANVDNIFLTGDPTIVLDQDFSTEFNQIELAANGPLFQLPAGAVSLALGAAYRQERFSGTQEAGGFVFQDVQGADRNVRSLYAELNAPLVASGERTGLHSLSLSLAGRYDRYSDFGSSTIPKVGLVYQPIEDLELKASWGKSFRASSLLQLFLPQTANLLDSPDPQSPTGSAIVLTRGGGNPELRPENSRMRTLSAAYAPAWAHGFRTELTYYAIDYDDRIILPATGVSPLTDPFAAPFIHLAPTPEELAEVLSEAQFNNFTNPLQSYDPSTVAALIEQRYTNALAQRARGFDLLSSYRFPTARGELAFALNATRLDLKQTVTVLSPEQTLGGTLFNPPRWRARGEANWQSQGWDSSLFINYIGSSRDPSVLPSEPIASWTTCDVQVAYRFGRNALSGTRVSLTAQNVFDREPPFVTEAFSTSPPGLHYDSTNAFGGGRYLALQLVRKW